MKKNKKNIVAMVLLIFFVINILILIVPALFVRADAPVKIFMNKKELKSDADPFISNDRVLVPVRMVFESMDAKVTWDGKERKATVVSNDTKFIFTIDSNIVIVNDKKIEIDVNAHIVNDRTFIPLRFFAENINMDVLWDGDKREVHINDKKPVKEEKGYVNLTGVDTSKETVIIETDSDEIKYKYFLLEDPLRLVIDIENCVNTIGNKTYRGTEYYTNIRHAQNSVEPMITRVVVELIENVKYTISSEKGNLEISFGEEKEESEKKEEDTNITSKERKTVVLDAGHGGKDPGALGMEGKKIVLNEKDVNLDIAMRVYNLLKKEDVNVYITRKEDVFLELTEIVEFAEEKKADLFVSIHNNASENVSTNGTMTMYAYDEAKEGMKMSGKELASIIQKHMVKATKGYNFGPVKNSALFVVRKTSMPAVITESLFITNEKDRMKLMDEEYKEEIAKSIAKGIMEAVEKL